MEQRLEFEQYVQATNNWPLFVVDASGSFPTLTQSRANQVIVRTVYGPVDALHSLRVFRHATAKLRLLWCYSTRTACIPDMPCVGKACAAKLAEMALTGSIVAVADLDGQGGPSCMWDHLAEHRVTGAAMSSFEIPQGVFPSDIPIYAYTLVPARKQVTAHSRSGAVLVGQPHDQL